MIGHVEEADVHACIANGLDDIGLRRAGSAESADVDHGDLAEIRAATDLQHRRLLLRNSTSWTSGCRASNGDQRATAADGMIDPVPRETKPWSLCGISLNCACVSSRFDPSTRDAAFDWRGFCFDQGL